MARRFQGSMLFLATILLLGCHILAQASGSYGYSMELPPQSCVLEMLLHDGDILEIEYGEPMFYILEGSTGSGHLLAATKQRKDIIRNRFLSIDGKTFEIFYSSSDPEKLTIQQDGTFEVLSPGDVRLSIEVGEAIDHIPIHIVSIPIEPEADLEQVIGILGVPNKRSKVSIRWPDSRFVDGVFYYPSVGRNVSMEHWFYERYPGAIIRLDWRDKIDSVVMPSWLGLSRPK